MGKKVASVGNLRKAFSVIQEVEVDEDDELSSEEEEVRSCEERSDELGMR